MIFRRKQIKKRRDVVVVRVWCGEFCLHLLRGPGERKDLRGRWCCPGGKVERDETVKYAAWRELREETGLEAKMEHLRPVGVWPSYCEPDVMFHAFECLLYWFPGEPKIDTIAVEERFKGYLWMHREESRAYSIIEGSPFWRGKE